MVVVSRKQKKSTRDKVSAKTARDASLDGAFPSVRQRGGFIPPDFNMLLLLSLIKRRRAVIEMLQHLLHRIYAENEKLGMLS